MRLAGPTPTRRLPQVSGPVPAQVPCGGFVEAPARPGTGSRGTCQLARDLALGGGTQYSVQMLYIELYP